MKKALILIGSPRKKGSTATLAAEAERALNEQGVETTTIFLNNLTIKGCQACYWCKKNDVAECAVRDDMQKIHALMQGSDGIIVAAPIYFAGVTAQTKLWLDRLFPYISLTLAPKMPEGKKVSFIFTQNQPDATLFETPIRTFMHMVGLTGLCVKDSMLGCDLDAGNKPPVEGRTDLLEQAYSIGKNLLL
ncbi:MAG: flavodoxin family protein [Methanomicrobiales archaeon HGW-Methanomicrobiales-3]|jgi:multimeric flavodoxin WrbA|nr:MAG: flavodoxin family protein [Methanomicrobiales archaeon HGW-Methanomicrobiales-3]